jgi:hypothetical protein
MEPERYLRVTCEFFPRLGTVCTMCPIWSVVQSVLGPSVDTCGVRSKSLSKSLDGMSRRDATGSSCATVEGELQLFAFIRDT